MTSRNPVEFTRELATGRYQRVGNQVQLVGAAAPAGGEQAVNLNPVPIDTQYTNSLIVMDSVHYEIHEGDYYSVVYKSPDASPIADNGVITLAIRTAGNLLHMVATASFGGDAEIELLEESTLAGGVAQKINNHNRYSSNVSSVSSVLLNPTVTGGTLLSNIFLPGGSSGNASVGIMGGFREEWILKTNTIYVVRATNRAGSAQPGSLDVAWYEESVPTVE